MSLRQLLHPFARRQHHQHVAAVLAAVIDHATTDRERRALNEGVTP